MYIAYHQNPGLRVNQKKYKKIKRVGITIKMGWKGWGCRGSTKVICARMEGF